MHFSTFEHWEAGTSEEPTWRNGLYGSDRTYAFVAVPKVSRNGYKAIVAGRINGSSIRVKFYPNPHSLGIETRQLKELGISHSVSRQYYESFVCSLSGLKDLLDSLDKEVWEVCPTDKLYLLEAGFGRENSRSRHPSDENFPTFSAPTAPPTQMPQVLS